LGMLDAELNRATAAWRRELAARHRVPVHIG
jgi:hypothetical protein